MAEPPGIVCQARNPRNINDGTMCAAQSPKPGIQGNRSFFDSAWDDVAWLGGQMVDGTVAAYHGAAWAGTEAWAGAKWAGSEVWAGTQWAGSELLAGAEWTGGEIVAGAQWGLGEIRNGAVWIGNKAYDAYKYLLSLFATIKKAGDWKTLAAIAEPILGPTFMQAGVLWGLVESLGKDVLGLLELGKMVVLAGCYELMQHPHVATAMAANPAMLPMVLTALALKAAGSQIPGLAAELKKADDQLRKMITDLWKVVSNWDDFLAFVKALGKQLKQGTIDDFNKFRPPDLAQ